MKLAECSYRFKIILNFAHDLIFNLRAPIGCHYGFALVSILRESTLSTWHPLHGTSNLTLTLKAPIPIHPLSSGSTEHRGLSLNSLTFYNDLHTFASLMHFETRGNTLLLSSLVSCFACLQCIPPAIPVNTKVTSKCWCMLI